MPAALLFLMEKRKGKLPFIVDLCYSSINFIILVSCVLIREFELQAPENANSTGLNNKGAYYISLITRHTKLEWLQGWWLNSINKNPFLSSLPILAY